jgi:hypothetical protein
MGHKFSKYSVLVFVHLVILYLCLGEVTSQEKTDSEQSFKSAKWIAFSSDAGFSIELPKLPKQTKKYNPGKVDETDYFRCTKSLLIAYKMPLRSSSRVLGLDIGVFDVSGCKRTVKDFNFETKFLVELFSADDDNDYIIRDQKTKIDGYRARIFVTRTSAGNYIWEMFVEAKQRIYWLGYSTDDPKGDSSKEAQRIFKSFHITKTAKKEAREN